NFLDINRLLSSILITGALMGMAFQFPIVLTVLMRLKVVKYKALVKQR
ncbi:MAG: Sec-independent protein translocase TatC, partial [Candidatus Levybacteria bacterium CG_4_10_14_0_2_um_filter_35_8]